MQKGLKTTAGLSRLEVLSSVIILAASLGMGMRTLLQSDQHLQKAASDSQFQAEAQLALTQMKNELQAATDAQIEQTPTGAQPTAVRFVKAAPRGHGQEQRYLLVRYWYQAPNGVGSLMRSVRDHGTSPRLHPQDLSETKALQTKPDDLYQQVLLTDARPVSLAPASAGSQRIRQLTLRLLAATPAQMLRRKVTLF